MSEPRTIDGELLAQPDFDVQTAELLAALDERNIQSRGDLEMYDRRSLDLGLLRRGVHEWFCTMSWEAHRPDSPRRPHVGWACERAVAKIVDVMSKAVR